MDGLLQNIITDRSIPEFVKDNYPTFEAFLKAYYEWMEESKNSLDIAKNLRDYRDIDNTIDEFVEYFRKEYLINIPENILADKRLLVKQIKNFYLNKGNEESFRFLFRLLYNDNIEFYYPKKDVLRASDGKWYIQISIKILVTDDMDLTAFESRQITGTISGATGVIESILNYTDRGVNVAELILNGVKGDFISSEIIEIPYLDEDDILQSYTAEIKETYTEIIITSGGSGYAKNDIIPIKDNENVEIGSSIVTQVSRGPVTNLTVEDGGIGYNGTEQQITIFAYLPINYTWNDIYLPDAPIQAQTSNDFDFSVEQINFPIDAEIIYRGNGDYIEITDSPNSSGNGASGIVSLVGDYGEILEIELISGGDLYETPTAEVISDTGVGAIINVIGGGGSIQKIKLQKFPIVLEEDFTSNGFLAYPDFTVEGDGNAQGYLGSGSLLTYPGRWLNEDGHLSSSKKLQDNRYYQDYSYVVKASTTLTEWRDNIKKIIHPAGLEVFGEVQIQKFKSSKLSRRFGKLIRKIRIESEAATATKTASMVQKFVTPTFDPSDIANLVMFQDAQSFDTLTFSTGSGDGALLSQWGDLTGNGNYIYRNNSSTHYFTYKPFGYFGKPALRKSGSRVTYDSINISMYSSEVTQIIFFTLRPDAVYLTGTIGGLFKSTALLSISGTRLPSYFRIQASATYATLPAWSSLNNLLMLAVTIENSTTANLYNGIDSTTFDPSNYNTSNQGARLGSTSPTTDGPEAEYYGNLLYNRSLTENEINKIYMWGQQKYGIPS